MTTPAGLAPVTSTVTVRASAEKAFEAFTARFDRWWPRSHHIGQAELAEPVLEPRQGGRWYERHLGIQRWKDRVPEAGALFAGGVSKRHLLSRSTQALERFAVETRRAERGHWLALAGAPLYVLVDPPVGVLAMLLYGLGSILPFIAIQRYNRARLARVLDARAARDRR